MLSLYFLSFVKKNTKEKQIQGKYFFLLSPLFLFCTENEEPRHTGKIQNEHQICKELCNENPNELSEELVKGLIRIFLLLNQAPPQDREELAIVPKLSLSCMNSKGPKTLFNSKASIFPFNHNESNLDPYRIMSDLDSIVRDIGPYKNFIQIERNSLDVPRLSECLPMAGKLRCLLVFSGHDDYSDTDNSNFRVPHMFYFCASFQGFNA